MAPVRMNCVWEGCTWEEMSKFALTSHMQYVHPVAIVAARPTGNKNMRGKMNRPSAGLEMTESKWRYFMNQWAVYKRTTRITGQDVVDELWQCPSDLLRMEVTSEQGANLENAMEADLIEAIKRMGVLESNPLVHRNNIRWLVQGESEKIRNFVARLREAAMD